MLAIMVRGGVSIEIAMEIAGRIADNKVIERSIGKARERVIAGSSIASSLKDDRNFPSLMLRMINIGESSARLPEVLNKVADMYEEQVEGSVMVLTSLFEPAAIIAFGGVVLLLILSIYVPVFKSAMMAR